MRRVCILLLAVAISQPLLAQAPPPPQLPLSEVLERFTTAPELRATESQLRAIEMDYASRDLVLQPQLELGISRFNEHRELIAFVVRNQNDQFNATLRKPFSTGTELSFTPSLERAQIPQLEPDQRVTVDWQFALTQSLWQNGFGRSTDLRWAREKSERSGEIADLLLRRGQLLADLEEVYWDWAMAEKETELRQNNVRRSQQILRWVQDRFRRAAAESTDLLNARALLANRELQLSTIEQILTQSRTRLERFLPGFHFRPDPRQLEVSRDPETLVSWWIGGTLGEAARLDVLQARYTADASSVRAREAREAIRPELNLALVYGKNAIDVNSDPAVRDSWERNHEYSSVGVIFRSGLDVGMERRRVESARANAESTRQRREALEAENKVAWPQLKRDLYDLQQRINRAKELVEVQNRKAAAERERYRVGRATAFQAITFEQEAAEAEISLWTLYTLMRKTEARARLFVR